MEVTVLKELPRPLEYFRNQCTLQAFFRVHGYSDSRQFVGYRLELYRVGPTYHQEQLIETNVHQIMLHLGIESDFMRQYNRWCSFGYIYLQTDLKNVVRLLEIGM